MRLFSFSLLFLLGFSIVGCGDSTKTQTMEVSEIEAYVTENPEAAARQAELTAGREDEDDEGED